MLLELRTSSQFKKIIIRNLKAKRSQNCFCYKQTDSVCNPAKLL